MEEIVTSNNRYTYHKLFTVYVDHAKRATCFVGKDDEGKLIMHMCEEYHIGNAYATNDTYYFINKDEYLSFLKQSLDNDYISTQEHDEFKNENTGG